MIYFVFFLLLKAALLLSLQSLNETSDICVVDTNITTLCEKWCNKQNFIHSLSDVPNIVDSGTTVWFCLSSGEIELNTTLHFHGIHNVSFQGLSEDSVVVNCSKSNSSTGFMFTQVEKLNISNLTFTGCGSVYDSGFHTKDLSSVIKFSSAIYIANSTNIYIQYVTIVNSSGNGLSISNTNGTVEVVACEFGYNKLENSTGVPLHAGGSGLYIIFENCSVSTDKNCRNHNSSYLVNKCYVHNNKATAVDPRMELLHGFGRGGGIRILIQGNAESNNLTIINCKLEYNSADVVGGGMHVEITGGHKNNICFSHSSFKKNYCENCGGGGVDVGYTSYTNSYPTNNTLSFYNCTFKNNSALYGGGTHVFSVTIASVSEINVFEFSNCSWMYNNANFGSAVDFKQNIKPTLLSYIANISFENCSFVSNYIRSKQNSSNLLPYRTVSNGRGAFYISKRRVVFKGTMHFEKNNGSALYMISSTLSCSSNINISFISNRASSGGAIVLIGHSMILVRQNTTFTFVNNTATHLGGAILYQLTDPQEYATSVRCFIQYIGSVQNVQERNILFKFDNNKVCNQTDVTEHCSVPVTPGNSIYASSLHACKRACSQSNNSKLKFFECIGRFEFTESIEKEVSTFGSYFKLEDNNDTNKNKSNVSVVATPGKEVKLNFDVVNDFQTIVPTEFQVTIDSCSSSTINIDNAYSLITDKIIMVNGNPMDSGTVTLSSIRGFHELILKFEVVLQQCPPGFVLTDDNHPKCVCSVNTNKSYVGVKRCNMTLFQAYLEHGYWIGYLNTNSSPDESTLLSGNCPIGFCSSHYTDKDRILLPSNASTEQVVCSENRKGMICGLCKSNCSVFYNSVVQHCQSENITLCRFGWLFYILSELVPVTIVFLIVLLFNISFTSGSVSGFIFFAQVVSVLNTTANNFIWLPHHIHTLQNIYLFLYQILSLKFSYDKYLSFCLWSGATTLDVLTFQYITIVYSLGLVFLMVFVMKFSSCRCRQKRHYSVRSSFLHGLSTFLVMTYTKCTRISLTILTFTSIFSQGGKPNRRVVFYNGEFEWMKGDHLQYALPAVFLMTVIIIIPTVMLLVYPLCYKVFKLLRIEESACVVFTCKAVPLERLKPLYDSFQHCFKDQFRFFAGLYFIYRFLIVALFAFCSQNQFYTFAEIVLVIALIIHSAVQPYKERWHNIVDTFMFGNLAIINGLTTYNYNEQMNESVADKQNEVHVYLTIQIVLAYLPLVYICSFIVISFISTIKSKFNGKNEDDDFDSEDMPARLIEDSISRFNYQAI